MKTPAPRSLEQDLNDLGQAIAPAKPLAPAIIAQLPSLPQNPHHILIRKWIMRTTLSLAAALILTALLISFLLPPTVAFAQVLQKVEQTKTLACDIQAEGKSIHIAISGDLMRTEDSDGNVSIGNRIAGHWLVLNPQRHTATKMTLASQPLDLYAWFRDFNDGKEVRLGEKTLNGRKVVGFKVVRSAPGNIPGAEQITLSFWVDPATNLPVEAEGTQDGHDITITNFKWNESLDEKLFAMTIPPDYTLQDMGGIASDQLKPPPTTQEAESLTLKPGIGIGDLKFGDSPDTITKILGKPEKVTLDVSWDYPSKGLSLSVFPKTGLSIIMAGSQKAFPAFNFNDFNGKTDKGLAIGSTRQQVETAYGKPDREEKSGNNITLYYDKAYIWFTLQSDQVIQIYLQPTKQALRNATSRAAQPELP